MIVIDDKILSDDLIEEQFICNLAACKGACCWQGDFGAPLEVEEIAIIEKILPTVLPYLTEEGKAVIEEKGVSAYYKEDEFEGTTLLKNGACSFMTYDENKVAKCGIEQAFLDGKTDYKKPISCHLYPIRITKNEGFEAVNYDRWDICKAACELGKKEQVPVYVFLKEPLIRKYGESFYARLDQIGKGLAKE